MFIDGYQETTQESTYKNEIVSEINDTEELPEVIFPIIFKTINHYQCKYPTLKAKYEMGTYQKDCFCGGSNKHLKLIMCKDKVVITPIIQSYVLHWYHAYLLHTGMDRTETMIHQNFYWPGIRYTVWKEVGNCDTLQRTKHTNENMVNYQLRKLRKYHGKTLCRSNMPLCNNKKGTVRKFNSKIHYHDILYNRMIQKTQYGDKRVISIANLVETMWLTRHPIPMEIMYDQGSECISH